MQQHQIASAYPGLLDGDPADGELPRHLGDGAGGAGLPPAQRATSTPARRTCARSAAAGRGHRHAGRRRLPRAVRRAARARHAGVGNYAGMWLDPANALGCGLRRRAGLHAANPAACAARCPTTWSRSSARRATDGFANRPYDNVGVQYGLRALQSGTITAEQFVDLNEKRRRARHRLGARRPSARSPTAPALDAAYRGGLITPRPRSSRASRSSTSAAPTTSRSTPTSTPTRCARGSTAPTATTTTR